MAKFWLVKSEPGCYSIDDLARDKQAYWSGVRNYQARNFMRDEMKLGDWVLFHHSNANPSGIAGLAKVCKEAHPDFTAWDPQDDHFDPKSSPENPIWMMVDLAFEKKFTRFLSLEFLNTLPEFASMGLLKKGNRLSVMPVEEAHFNQVMALGA